MDATTVKAEIKNWEHDFRARNGRIATIEDIKALPLIGVSLRVLRALVTDAMAKLRSINCTRSSRKRWSGRKEEPIRARSIMCCRRLGRHRLVLWQDLNDLQYPRLHLPLYSPKNAPSRPPLTPKLKTPSLPQRRPTPPAVSTPSLPPSRRSVPLPPIYL